jgi:hypothetical protein
LSAVRRILALAACALALSWAQVLGQVTVEEGVSTDTVDLFAKRTVPQKSGVLAMCASILLPGLGHQYLGDNTKALAYYSAEALFIFGGLLCDHYSKRTFEDAKVFAWAHAKATDGAGADYRFWQMVGAFDETNGYNEEMDRITRNPGEKNYQTPDLQWHWDDVTGTSENRTRYDDMLKRSLTFQTASTFFIGAMVLNRLVSFIDARVTAKNMETKPVSSVRFVPQYDPQTRAAGLSMNFNF